MSIAHSLYGALTWLVQPLVRLKLAQRAKAEGLYGEHVGERFGHYAQPVPQGLIWIHAVSLGESRAAAILVRAIREIKPDARFLWTHGTATGRAEGAKHLQAGDVQLWQPWDSVAATRAFFAHTQPRVGLIMETEVWPNWLAAAHEAGVPVLLANARLSPASLRSALRVGALSRNAYASFAQVLAQTEDDAARLRQAGSRSVTVCGNLKFDAQTHDAQLAQALQWRTQLARPVCMLASSREGEEAQWLSVFLEQNRHFARMESTQDAIESVASRIPKPLWLIVPRHPQRFGDVAQMLTQAGLRVVRRSEVHEDLSALREADVWLGDTLGEMSLYYGLSELSLLGGSFEPLGGQNLIESIAAQCPVIMGPHTFNFDEAARGAEDAGTARRVSDMREAMQLAQSLIEDAHARQAMQQAGAQWLSHSRGAAARMARQVLAHLRA
jgi:3-deoxy-D-manno-octulosonic-acid transferase